MKKKQVGMPLEILTNCIDKKISLIIRKDKIYIGKLKEFDQHLNVFMEDAYEIIEEGCKFHVGTVLINGGTIAMIDIE